jgi:predicted Zn-dependent peptidase
VGAYHEPAGRSGFAHLFEHMMFQGSKHVADDAHIAILEQIGGTSVNATTDYDRTNYFETVPANQLETVLWLESDRMGFLLDTLTQKKLDTQRSVVQNERRESFDARPYGAAEERLIQALFPLPHPYHGAVIGSMKDLDAATVQDVRDFFLRWYSPSNATLTVAGDFDPEHAKTLIAHYFGDLRGPPRPVLPQVSPAVVDQAVVIHHEEKVGKLPQLRVAWHSPGFFQEGNAAADLLGLILADGKASRLHHRLVTQKGLAQSVRAAQESLYRQSIFEVQITGRPLVSTDALLHELDAELEDIQKNGVRPQELTRARNRAETALVAGLQAVGGLGGKADTLQVYNHYLGDPGQLEHDLERFSRVMASQVQALARTLSPQHRVVLHAVPVVGAHP